MKTSRKTKAVRKTVRRRTIPMSLTARVARLEKQLLLKPTAAASVAMRAAATGARFINLDADGKPTGGDHVIVRDTRTGLEWLAEPLQAGKRMNHGDAMKACAALDVAGHKDWRAPTRRELLSIIDDERYDPAVDPAHFKGPHGYTWTSTPFKGSSGAAWVVFLVSGYSDWGGHGIVFRVRAVRAGQNLGLLD